MKIQAINFKTPIIKSNLSFKDRDIIINKDGVVQDVFVCSLSKVDPKKEFRGHQIQADSLNVLSWANTKQKEAKRMYAEAKKIHRTWQEKKPNLLVENATVKEFLASYGSLHVYYESKPNGTERIIKYLYDKPVEITEIDSNDKKTIYSFSDSGNLERLVEGKHEKATKKVHRFIIEGIYTFLPNGYLESYKENQQEINVFDRQEMLKKTVETADVFMSFDVAGKRPYLKEAQSGILNDGFRNAEATFKYDENGKLIEAR